MTEPMTAQFIVGALYRYYKARDYLCLHELRPGTGYTAGGNAGGIDFWAMHQWPSEKHLRIAIEIKISKSDYQREKAKPEKQKFALAYSNMLFFATPPKMIDPWTLRPDAGLIEVSEEGTIRIVKPAPFREGEPPVWNFMAGVMRRLEALRTEAEQRSLLSEAHDLSRIEGKEQQCPITMRLHRSTSSNSSEILKNISSMDRRLSWHCPVTLRSVS